MIDKGCGGFEGGNTLEVDVVKYTGFKVNGGNTRGEVEDTGQVETAKYTGNMEVVGGKRELEGASERARRGNTTENNESGDLSAVESLDSPGAASERGNK